MAESRRVRIQILEKRVLFLLGKLESEELPENKRRWLSSEIKALEWAIPVLKDFVDGKMKRILKGTDDEN